jgi:hypothetical protein
VLPIDDSGTQVLPPSAPLAFPTDDSPTQLLSLDELALPIHDSPTLAEPVELGSAPEWGGESPPPSESTEPDAPDEARHGTPRIRRAGRCRAH